MSAGGTFLDPRVVALLTDAHVLYTRANLLLKEAREAEDAAREIVKQNGHPHVESNSGIPDQERRRRTLACPEMQWGTPRPEIVEGTFG